MIPDTTETKTFSLKFVKNVATVVVLFVPVLAVLSVQRFKLFGFPGMFNRVR